MNDQIIFFLIGVLTGGIGTLVGAGGGFLLAPLFLFIFPHWLPAKLTAISLLAVAANSTSGSIGYAFRQQVHWPSTFLFSIAAVPGVFIGVQLSHLVDRKIFEIVFSIFLLALSVFVLISSGQNTESKHLSSHFWNKRAQITGCLISFFIGILSSLLGIGGGIVHVPLLSELLNYPLHVAAGTSHAILAITSSIAVVEHFRSGDFGDLESFVPFLIVGLVFGAQIGAAYSKRVERKWILRILGIALLSVAIRLIYKNLIS